MNELARVVHEYTPSAEANGATSPANLAESELIALQNSQHWLSLSPHELAARLIELAEPGEWWVPVPMVTTATS